MVEPRHYTAQFQAGLGMINETLSLLRLWEPGDTPSRLADRVVASGVFARATARRARNIAVEMFAPRFMVDGDHPADWMRALVDAGAHHDDLSQLFFLHTARAQQVFRDFVTEVYWTRYSAGALRIGRLDSERFIHRALDAGRMPRRWTENTIRHVSGYLLGCCSDFGLLEGPARSDRAIQRFSIRPKVALYLAHDLRFSGFSDSAIPKHPDWHLFGLEPQEALNEVKKLGNDGHLIVQAAADLVQISWRYPTMEDCVRAIAQR